MCGHAQATQSNSIAMHLDTGTTDFYLPSSFAPAFMSALVTALEQSSVVDSVTVSIALFGIVHGTLSPAINTVLLLPRHTRLTTWSS